MKTHALIVAAGKGTRASSSTRKQFELFGGKPLYKWSTDAFRAHTAISTITLVLPEDSDEEFLHDLAQASSARAIRGGESRSQSVLNGLESIDAAADDIVFIHDAARPGLCGTMIDLLMNALESADAAAPALSVNDALKRRNGSNLSSVDRADLFRVQTPQAFRYGQILLALQSSDLDLVDDLAAVEASGARIELVEGDRKLDKITFSEDFPFMEKLLAQPSGRVRTGMGYDVHRFEAGTGVTICGTLIPHTHRLEGHSDADVGWHALTDAILGAAALGDIGDHFPPSDPQWKGASSDIFLAHAIQLVGKRGWTLDSCDITIICEAPKIKPNREAMRSRTAEVAGVSLEQVSVKATTTEGLGFTGRREGIAAQAVATLVQTTSSGE